ncbi:hypothetical protein [Anabaena lutea]|uniref:Uncharacterized protein n=1 Tax=Anabaena lutea FACHB-196 TaxID=2692881 RepID=A0ABR8FPR9_9NOST|nr:hypothetical protein [Anabaena lutea]MBD2570880.1 hypothetical protein [Anabaena lutea FACHB-196]
MLILSYALVMEQLVILALELVSYLATLSGTSGFNSANFNVNLFGANFLFS